MKQVFQTVDGKIFEDRDAALRWEKSAFERWLENSPVLDLKAISDTLDDENEDEYYGTRRDMFYGCLQEYHNKR